MKKLILALGLLAVATPAAAQYYGTGSNSRSHYVQPHTRSNGDSVGGHYRTNPNNSRSDNYGASGNYNPYSGRTSRSGSGYNNFND